MLISFRVSHFNFARRIMARREPRRAAPTFEELIDDYESPSDELDSDSDNEEDHLEEESGSSSSESGHEEAQHAAQSRSAREDFIGKDGTVWSFYPPPPGRFNSANVFHQREGPTASAKKATIIETFSLMCPDDIIQTVTQYTNDFAKEFIARNPGRWYSSRWRDVDTMEMKAFIGCLLYIGVFKSRHESYSSLWSKEHGRAPLRAAMSLSRFTLLLKFLRFDDTRTRSVRKQRDKLAPIREIWNSFLSCSRKFYVPGCDTTIDEQLVGFRGRCPFRMYIPSKPSKYGMKIWTLADSKSFYIFNYDVYLGKRGTSPEVAQGKRVVEELMQPLFGSGRNVTVDNFFTSVPLAQSLLQNTLTLTGTIRSNKREIPPEFKANSQRQQHSCVFGFTRRMMMCSYVPKRHKSVILLSTQHRRPEISDRDDRKPLVILDYNSCKGAVDTIDQMIASYSCARATRRWPLRLFFHLLDTAALNAFIVWTKNVPSWNSGKNFRRRLFLTDLAFSLMHEHTERRGSVLQLHRSVREAIEDVGVHVERETVPQSASRGRCQLCPTRNQVKSRCMKCSSFICKDHSSRGSLCNQCF